MQTSTHRRRKYTVAYSPKIRHREEHRVVIIIINIISMKLIAHKSRDTHENTFNNTHTHTQISLACARCASVCPLYYYANDIIEPHIGVEKLLYENDR